MGASCSSAIECCSAQRVIFRPVGEPLEKYWRLEEPLGDGGTSIVHKCRARDSDDVRACKSIRKAKVPDQIQLRREVDILTDLQRRSGRGAYIIKLFEVLEDSSDLHLIFELCAGGELFERQSKMGFFSEPDAACLFQQMLQAIAHVHASHVVHRDLKLENWLLLDRKGLRIKLADFGFSRRLAPGERLTGKLGSPYYVAPEVLEGEYDVRADLWSLGVILYMLLSGRPPFNGPRTPAILDAVRAAKVSLDGPQWQEVSSGARDLVARFLQKEPGARPCAEEGLMDGWLRSNASG